MLIIAFFREDVLNKELLLGESGVLCLVNSRHFSTDLNSLRGKMGEGKCKRWLQLLFHNNLNPVCTSVVKFGDLIALVSHWVINTNNYNTAFTLGWCPLLSQDTKKKCKEVSAAFLSFRARVEKLVFVHWPSYDAICVHCAVIVSVYKGCLKKFCGCFSVAWISARCPRSRRIQSGRGATATATLPKLFRLEHFW